MKDTRKGVPLSLEPKCTVSSDNAEIKSEFLDHNTIEAVVIT